MTVRTKAGLKQQITTLLPDNTDAEISEADARSVLNDIVDSMALAAVVVVIDDMYFGTSVDAIPEPAEATVAAAAGVGTVPAYAGSMHLLIFRLASESDIASVLFSDDASNTNQVGAFAKYADTVVPVGETEDFNAWVSNQALTQSADVTLTVS